MIIKKHTKDQLSIVFFTEDKANDFLYNHILHIVPDEDSTSDIKNYKFHQKNPTALVSDRKCTVNSINAETIYE